jgi:hypothetical protein
MVNVLDSTDTNYAPDSPYMCVFASYLHQPHLAQHRNLVLLPGKRISGDAYRLPSRQGPRRNFIRHACSPGFTKRPYRLRYGLLVSQARAMATFAPVGDARRTSTRAM